MSHVSSYALTLDELAVDVPMAKWVRQGRVEVASADRQADLGQVVRETLEAGGLRRYEISNYARPGAESVHNTGYWIGDPYVGLGVGAFGADLAERYGNTRQISPYLEALGRGELPQGEREALDSEVPACASACSSDCASCAASRSPSSSASSAPSTEVYQRKLRRCAWPPRPVRGPGARGAQW